MGDTLAKRHLGLLKLTKVGHSVFTLSLVYGTKVMSTAEVMTPSLRVMQVQKKEKNKEIFAAERCEDLEGLDEKREEAKEHSRKYRQRMMKAYGRMIRESVFLEGQLVLKATDHVKRGLAGLSKFSPK